MSIGQSAFSDCPKITESEGGVVYLGKWALERASIESDGFHLETVVIREGTIGLSFCANENAKTILIPKSVKYISEKAFGMVALDRIYYGGSIYDFDRIYFGIGNGMLEAAAVYYYPDEELHFWEYQNGVPTPKE